MRKIVVASTVILGACAPQRVTHKFGDIQGFTYKRLPKHEVQAAYRADNPKTDDEEIKGVRCFFRSWPRELWVAFGEDSCWPHELKHASGVLDENEVRKVFPN